MSDIVTLNGYKIKDEKAVRRYETVALMKADTKLKEGYHVKTKGYYEANDGGHGEYIIVDDETLVDDGGSIHVLSNGLRAKLIITNGIINILQYGLLPNNDITSGLNTIGSYISNNKIKELVFNEGTYNLTNIVVLNPLNEKFKINFNGAKIKLTTSLRGNLININMNKDINSSLEIINGNFDGSDGNQPDFSPTNYEPVGCRVFKIDGARNLTCRDLYFNDWFFSCPIYSLYVDNAIVENCRGINVGGRDSGWNGTESVDYSYEGDAINFAYVGVVYQEGTTTVDRENSHEGNILINNCSFSSYEAVENPYSDNINIKNGCRSGRCGIVLAEFSDTGKKKTFTINNSYFYNYQRSLHNEANDKVSIIVNNTTFEDFGSVLHGGTEINNAVFTNCHFIKNIDVRGLAVNYDTIFAGTPNYQTDISFINCSFENLAGKLTIYTDTSNISFENCRFEVERISGQTGSLLKFNNCDIKANKGSFYNLPILLNNTRFESQYKHDSNSGMIEFSGSFEFNNSIVIKNSKLINFKTNIQSSNEPIYFYNNIMEYTNNGSFNTSLLGIFHSNLKRFSNNHIINNNTINRLFNSDLGTINANINDNLFENIMFSINNSQNIGLKIYNNKFISENSDNAINFWNSVGIIHDNLAIGYTKVINNNGDSSTPHTITQYNNYTSSDGITATLQS